MKSYIPGDAQGLDPKEYAEREFKKIQQVLESYRQGLIMPPTYVAPTKPQEGELRYADGTHWNPGSGAGLYQYRVATGWNFLG